MSMFESIVAKNGQSRYIACKVARPSPGWEAFQALTALPKPYQPGSIRRHGDQLNTHGMARKSSMRRELVREAGRLPIFRLAISPITVDSWKYCSNPSVS